jgi:hypothetical protein
MDSEQPYYGFMTFNGFTMHIPSHIKTIGIITQPFDVVGKRSKVQYRDEDSSPHQLERCRIVVSSFVEYIQQKYPHASIRIRNNIDETVTLAFARMIFSNVLIIGSSTFGFLASIATFGTAYQRNPNPSIRFDQLVNNLVYFDEPDFISVSEIKHIWETQGAAGVLQWFWNGTTYLE